MNKTVIQQKAIFAGPLYVQVADMIRERIEELEWRPDLPMPNESQLAKEFGVSIGTMRKALESLEAEKIIHRKQGRGTFVIDSSFEVELARFPNLYKVDLVRDCELPMVTKTQRPPTAIEAESLALNGAQDIIEIARGRHREGAFSSLERLVIPAELFQGIEEIENLTDPLLFTIYRRDFHVVVASTDETILPVNASEATARELGVEQGTAVLMIRRRAFSAKGEAVEWSERFVYVTEAIAGRG